MQKSVIFVKKRLKINTVELEITAIIQENTEVRCIAYVI